MLFSVSSSVVPLTYPATDYRQYPSLAFLSLALAIGLFTLLPGHRMRFGAIAALTAYFGLSAYHMNTHWRTEESFWRQSVRHGGAALAHSNYAHSVVSKDPALAEHHYLEALRLFPNHVYANINLGMLYIRQGKAEDGLRLVWKVVRQNPQWSLTHYWHSKALGRLGRAADSLVALRGSSGEASR